MKRCQRGFSQPGGSATSAAAGTAARKTGGRGQASMQPYVGKWGTFSPCASLGFPMCTCWTASAMPKTSPVASPRRCFGTCIAWEGGSQSAVSL